MVWEAGIKVSLLSLVAGSQPLPVLPRGSGPGWPLSGWARRLWDRLTLTLVCSQSQAPSQGFAQMHRLWSWCRT